MNIQEVADGLEVLDEEMAEGDVEAAQETALEIAVDEAVIANKEVEEELSEEGKGLIELVTCS